MNNQSIDTALYVAMGMLTAVAALPALPPYVRETAGVLTAGAVAWKAKRSQGTAPDPLVGFPVGKPIGTPPAAPAPSIPAIQAAANPSAPVQQPPAAAKAPGT